MCKLWNLFKRKERTSWIDVGMFDSSGHYKLTQMRMVIESNKKEFRTVDLGFVNDYTTKLGIYDKVLKHNVKPIEKLDE
jgi:hypothetical protein